MFATTAAASFRHVAARVAVVLTAIAAVLVLAPANQASAASQITAPSNLVCERYDNKLSVSPPRVWASSRTEQVGWSVGVQRWNGSSWTQYSNHTFWASFNIYGQNVSGWNTYWYSNNTMNIPVYHSGYYRVYSAVAGGQGGATWQGYVSGGGYCRVV